MTHPVPDADAQSLREFLADRDTPCPGCGYNLRQLTTSVCPECGDHLELRVNLADPRLGAWLTGMIASACGAGFNGLLLFYVGFRIAMGGWQMRGLPPAFVSINAAGLIVMGLALWAWIRARPKFRRAPKPAQVRLIAGAWALTAIDVIVFAAAIR